MAAESPSPPSIPQSLLFSTAHTSQLAPFQPRPPHPLGPCQVKPLPPPPACFLLSAHTALNSISSQLQGNALPAIFNKTILAHPPRLRRASVHPSPFPAHLLLDTPLVFPIFNKPGDTSSPILTNNSVFRWISPALGPKRSCLHGVNRDPKLSTKVAAFDLDGCLIHSSFPKKASPPSFEWWRKVVPNKLKEAHEQGYAPPTHPLKHWN